MKRLLFLLTMTLVSVSIVAYDFEVDGICYEIFSSTDNTVSVTNKYEQQYTGDVVIPEKVLYNGKTYSVTSIDYEAFYCCTYLTSVMIPNSVTSIGNFAFAGCSGLTSITIPNSVTSIGDDAFMNCTSLTSVTIPNSVTSIGSGTFGNCTSLASVTIPNSVTTIGDHSFEGCSGLTSITIPNSVTCIEGYAFQNCSGLTSITIPNSVTTIGEFSFADCSSLTSVTIPNSVTCIEGYAFQNCTSLTSVTIPNSVTSTGYASFYGCSGLTTVTIPNSVASIGDYSFSGCSGLTSITIPNSVTTIGEFSFADCSGLTSVTIPNSVMSIGDDAFSNCSGLTSVMIPNSVTSIGHSAFQNCRGLTSFTIPNSVTTIDFFGGCSGLTSVTIPNHVTSIGYDAFRECSSLTSITIPNSVTSIGDYAFADCSALTSIKIPSSVTSIGYCAFNCSGLTSVTIPNSVTCLEGYVFSDCTSLNSVTIPNSVTSIGYGTFSGCSSLTSVTIPNSVTAIEESAFHGCSGLTSVTIPNSVTSIGEYAFVNCTSLTSVTIPNSVTTIGDYAFNCSGLTSVTIPNSVTSIGRGVFSFCSSLASVTIPNSVISIGYEAFFNCRHLTYITSLICEPFAIFDVFSEDTYKTATLYVPVGTIEAYKAISEWKNFIKIEDIQIDGSTFTLIVNDENGSDITNKVSITWYGIDGKEIGIGKSINGIKDGMELYYSVELDEELSRLYREVKMQKVVVNSEVLTCQLKRIEELNLHGKVTSGGETLADVGVSLTQWLNGKYEYTASTKTDENGEFTLKAYNDSTLLLISAKGYVDREIERRRLYSADLGTIELEQAQGMVVSLQLSYQEAVRESEDPIVQNWYSDTRNIAYTIRNMTKDVDITDFAMQMGDIVLPFGSEPNDRMQVTLRSLNDKFAEVSGEGVISSEGIAEIALRLVAYGGIEAVFSNRVDDQLLVMLYDSDGKLVSSSVISSSRVSFTGLKAGNYTLVTLGYNGAIGSVGALADFGAFGLVEDSDYVMTTVTVQDGIIGKVNIDDVPEIDASKFEYTSLNTSYLPNKSQMTLAGPLSYITLTARVDFKTQYANEVSDVKVVVDIPDSCEFMPNSVVTGTKALPHTLNGNRLTISLGQEDIDSRIRFCMIPKQTGTFTSTAYTEFDCRGEMRQTIGSAVFETMAGSISVPSITASKTIAVNGIALPHATVDVYDDDQLIGTTTALGDGKWRTEAELYKPYNLSTHEIYAKYQTEDGINATTESQECLYDISQVKAKSVTMSFYNAYMRQNISVVFDFETGKTSSTNYSFYKAANFTFVADLAANDTTRVKGVTFYVHTTTKEVRQLKGFFDGNLNRWVAVSYFDSNNLPVNLDVEVEKNYSEEDILLDRQQLDDGLASASESFEETKAFASEINDLLTITEVPLENEEIYNELEELLDGEDIDEERLNYLIDQLLSSSSDTIVDLSDEEIEWLIANSDKEQEEFEQWMQYIQGQGKDDFLSVFMMDSNIIGEEMPELPFSFVNESEEGKYEYRVRKLESIDEAALLDDGYTIRNMSDCSKMYVHYTSEGHSIIDGKSLIEYSMKYNLPESPSSTRAINYDFDPSCITTLKNLVGLFTPNMDVPDNLLGELEKTIDTGNQMMDAVSCIYLMTKEATTILVNLAEDALLNETYLKSIDKLLEEDDIHIASAKAVLKSIKEKDVVSLRNYKVATINLKKAEVRKGIHQMRKKNLIMAAKMIDPKIKQLSKLLKSLPKDLFKCRGVEQAGKLGTFMKYFGKVAGGLGVIVDAIEFANYWKDSRVDLEVMKNFVKEIDEKMPCTGDEANALKLKIDIYLGAKLVDYEIQNILGGLGSKTVIDAIGLAELGTVAGAPISLALWVVSVWDGVLTDIVKIGEIFTWETLRFNFSGRLAALKCGKDPNNNDDNGNGGNGGGNSGRGNRGGNGHNKPPFSPITPIHDPSGYVYEAVPTNRVKGVTATIYFDQEKPTQWDAVDFSQVNPQVTDETGLYQWDVPQGMWQVRFEKSGYETTQTGWLPVPPPQLEINIPMSEAVAPTVVKALGMESGITLEFSKYMKPATLEKSGRVSATVNGKNVSGDVEMLNLEEAPYNNKEYASKVKFVPSTAFKITDEVVITVKKEVESYAVKQMEADFVAKVKIEPEINGFACDSIIAVDYQGSGFLEIAVLPAAAAKGRTVSISSTSAMIATTQEQSVILNDEGKATITVNGNLPGVTSLHLQLDGMDIEKYVEVSVVLHEKVVKTPKASKRSGSAIEAGYLLWLTCNTPGATIYYTLDGSCPCDETKRIKYTEPFVLPAGEVTVKAIAVRQGMEDSGIATYTYTVEGAVGIAKVKADLCIDTKFADGMLTIMGAEGCTVRVYDLLGRELAGRWNEGKNINLQVPLAESYIVSVTTQDGQTVVRKVMGR